MKKIVLLTFVLMLLMARVFGICFSQLLAQNPETKLYVDPPISTASLGEIFTVDIKIANVEDLWDYEFRLGWDPALLDVTRVTEGPFLNAEGAYSTFFVKKEDFPSIGHLYVACTLLGEPRTAAASGNGTLAIVEFRVLDPGNCTLDLYDTLLEEPLPEHNPIPHITEDGYYQHAEIIVPDDYGTIQWAINNASDGDTIFVRANTYYEHVVVNKSVSLIGENKYNTIIDGNGTGTVVNIEANNVNITGFTIQKSGTLYLLECGIYVGEGNIRNNVSCNIIMNNYYGIVLLDSSNNTIFGNNVTANIDFGVWLEGSSNYNSISENNITDNLLGILLTSFSNYNNIFGNNVTDNGQGISLDNSLNNSITGNDVAGNDHSGIWLSESSNNIISGNNVAKNENGIYLAYSSNNTITKNNITSNSCGITSVISSNNAIYQNNFVDNIEQVDSYDSTNAWDDGASKGNYWSDYEERYPNATELDDSGIWDTPYVIDENTQDNYPIVPEFPTWTSMLLIIIMLTVAIATYKRRLLKTPIH